MKFNKLCEICGIKQAAHKHHKFPQYKRYRKLYRSIIDKPFNIQDVCIDCHLTGKVITWSEIEFIQAAQAEGFRVSVSKSLRFKIFNKN